MAAEDRYTPVHAYGGREHDQPAPVEGCLICARNEALAQADESRQLNHRLIEEIVDLKQALTMLRDAWNAQFAVCANTTLEVGGPTWAQVQAWMEAPTNTASAHVPNQPMQGCGCGVDHSAEAVIQIDRLRYTATKTEMTGAEICSLPIPAVPAKYDLFLEESEYGPRKGDRLIIHSDVVQITPGMRFYTAPKVINAG